MLQEHPRTCAPGWLWVSPLGLRFPGCTGTEGWISAELKPPGTEFIQHNKQYAELSFQDMQPGAGMGGGAEAPQLCPPTFPVTVPRVWRGAMENPWRAGLSLSRSPGCLVGHPECFHPQ